MNGPKECDDTLLSSPAWSYRKVDNARRIALADAMSVSGFNEPGQPFILFMLEHAVPQGGLSAQRELSDHLGVSPATITASLKSLERQGYITRVSDESDMRRKRIMITSLGREVVQECIKAFRIVDDAMYLGFTEHEQELLMGFYKRIYKNLCALTNGGNKT